MRSDPELVVRFEWEPAPGVRSPELRATWARLEMWIGDDCVTLVEDQESQSSRRSIYVPLYPLAEWIAYSWWLLKADARPLPASGRSSAAPGRTQHTRRHSVRSAGDGFCWPDLLIIPEGRVTRLVWRRDHHAPASGPVRFINQGEALLDGQVVEQTLSTLVETVLTRLTEQGVTRSTLATEWEQLLQTDEEEAEFCLAAARLGLDPYSEAVPLQTDILRAAEALDGQVFEDFLNAVNPRGISAGLEWIAGARSLIESGAGSASRTIEQLRSRVRHGATDPRSRPWDLGWRQADEFRRLLDVPSEEPLDLADLIESRASPTADRGLQALGGARHGTTPIVVIGRGQVEELRRFTLARGLWRVLYQDDPLFLVTAAHTDRQKIERAFAAQLLAPAEGVAKRLGDGTDAIPMEDVDPVARHFRVSPMVIEHQIENQLAGTVVA
jgi:hypothetical protein